MDGGTGSGGERGTHNGDWNVKQLFFLNKNNNNLKKREQKKIDPAFFFLRERSPVKINWRHEQHVAKKVHIYISI